MCFLFLIKSTGSNSTIIFKIYIYFIWTRFFVRTVKNNLDLDRVNLTYIFIEQIRINLFSWRCSG